MQRYTVLKKHFLSFDVNGRATQSVILFGSMVLAMGLNLVSSIITTRLLGPARYGDLKFVQSVWTLLSLVSTLGYLQAGSRVLLLEKDATRMQEIVGTVLVLVVVMGGSMALCCIAFARPIDLFFRTQVAETLIWLAPLAVCLPMQSALALILQSTNRIYWLGILNGVPPVLYILSLLLVWAVGAPATWLILFLQQFTVLVVMVIIIVSLRPRLASVRYWLAAVREQNKTYGWPVYTGALAGVATGQLNRLAISYWVDNTSVGFYSLALALVEPLKMIPNAVATSSFRDFAYQKRVSRRVLLATVGTAGVTLLAALVLFGEPLSWVYTEAFASVSPMASVASFGAVLWGLGDFFNRFLGARGKGNSLRNVAFLVGVVNTVGFFTIVPLWGAWGALSVMVMASISYLVFMFWTYLRHVRQGMVIDQRVDQVGSSVHEL